MGKAGQRVMAGQARDGGRVASDLSSIRLARVVRLSLLPCLLFHKLYNFLFCYIIFLFLYILWVGSFSSPLQAEKGKGP
jgi:hypothetical protein